MEPKLVDLNDFILSGGGFMGENYNHRDDKEIMLKLYPLDWTKLATRFAALCRVLHSTRVNKEELPSTKEFYVSAISTDPFLTSAD